MGFPTARDAVIASEVSWAMLDDAVRNLPPAVGTPAEMQAILESRRSAASGYGLPVRHEPSPVPPSALPRDRCA